MPTQKIQFKMKYNGTEYEFSIDPVATEGSGNPVASNALHNFMLQLNELAARHVATPSEPHGRVWNKSDKKWVYQRNNDNSLITADAMLDVIDYIRTNWIDPIITKIDGIPNYEVVGSDD